MAVGVAVEVVDHHRQPRAVAEAVALVGELGLDAEEVVAAVAERAAEVEADPVLGVERAERAAAESPRREGRDPRDVEPGAATR